MELFPGLDNGSQVSIMGGYSGDGEDRATLPRSADTAMYQAKSDGRSIWCRYSDEMTRSLARHFFG